MTLNIELIQKLRRDCPIFQNNVYGVPEYEHLRGQNGEFTNSANLNSPSCYIIDMPREFVPVRGNTFEQQVNYRFLIMVLVNCEERNKDGANTVQQFTSQSITLSERKYDFNTDDDVFVVNLVVKNADESITYSQGNHYFFDPYTDTLEFFEHSNVDPSAELSVSYITLSGDKNYLDIREKCYLQIYNSLIGYDVVSLKRAGKVFINSTYHVDLTDKLLFGAVEFTIPTWANSKINCPAEGTPIQSIGIFTDINYINPADKSGLTQEDYTNLEEC